MKNKGKILSLGLLVICFAIFVAGVYALKNATLTASGTIGFTAHDCNILVYGKITGAVTDPDDMTGEEQELYLVNYDGSGDFSKTAAFDFTGTKELTFENDLYSYDEALSEASHEPIIYFNDSGDAAPDIVITLYLKNNSAYPVNVRVDEINTPGGVESKYSDLTRLENNVDEYSELTITLTLTDNQTEISTLTQNFSMSIYFAKAKEQLPAPSGVTVDNNNKTVTFEPVEGATSYEIAYFKEGEDDGDPLYTQETTQNENIVLEYEPTEGGNYVIKVRAVREEDGITDYSSYSNSSEPLKSVIPTSAQFFKFQKNKNSDTYAVTGYTGDNNVEEIVIPKTFDFASDGKTPVDGDTCVVDTVSAASSGFLGGTSSGFKNYKGSIVLLDNIVTIDVGAFSSCSSIKKIILPKTLKTINSKKASAVANNNGTFYKCDKLSDVYYQGTLKEWCNIDFINTNSNPCCNSANLYINGNQKVVEANFEGITEIKPYAFDGCSSLQTAINTQDLTKIGEYAFQRSGITEITISNGVTKIEPYTFCGCESLVNVELNGNVAEIGEYAFFPFVSLQGIQIEQKSTNINKITIPSSVTKIGTCAFSSCNNLTEVYYSGTLEQWCNIGFVDQYSNPCCNVASLYVNGSEDPVESVNFADFSSDITEIKPYIFNGCNQITQIVLPDKITSIGEYSFRHTSIRNITIPTNVTTIQGYAFDSCIYLANVYYNGTLEQWCNIDFSGVSANPCNRGASLYVNGSESSVKSVNFGDFSSDYTKIKPYILAGCKDISNITIPKSITYIGNYAFEQTVITEITIPDSITTIGSGVFSKCQSLQNVTILANITIIDSNTFDDCSNLQYIVLPSSVGSIGTYAFGSCENLTKIYYTGDESQFTTLLENVETNGNEDFKSTTVYYQVANADAAASASGNWWYYKEDGSIFDSSMEG